METNCGLPYLKTKMCKLLSAMLGIALPTWLLAACGLNSTTPAQTPSPTATADIPIVQNLAQAFMAAYRSENVGNYFSLFSDDAVFLDNSTPFRSFVTYELVRNSQNYVSNLFKSTNFVMELNTYVVSRDGRFIFLTGTYTNTGKDGKLASVPIVIILEVENGKIVREDQYYDNSRFY